MFYVLFTPVHSGELLESKRFDFDSLDRANRFADTLPAGFVVVKSKTKGRRADKIERIL